MPPPCVRPNREGFCTNPAPFFLQTVGVGFTSLFVSLGFVVASKPLVAVETLEELFLPPGLIPDSPGLPAPATITLKGTWDILPLGMEDMESLLLYWEGTVLQQREGGNDSYSKRREWAALKTGEGGRLGERA